MSEREFDARCDYCGNHWYLRLRYISDARPVVSCPKCRHYNIAIELPPIQ